MKQALTLDQAVTIALRESPMVRGAQEEVEAAMGRVKAAYAETRPWLSLNTFASGGSNGNIIASPMTTQPQMITALTRGAFLDQNLMLMFPLYTGGRLSALTRQASALGDASKADRSSQQQEVAFTTRLAYREVLAHQALIAVAQARLAENKERLRIDQNRFQQGAVPALMLRRDEAEVAAAEQEATDSERDLDLAIVQLKTVMGVHPGSEFTLTDTNDDRSSQDFLASLLAQAPPRLKPQNEAANLPADLSALFRLAECQRPELQAIADRVRAAKADTSVARSAFQPQVNLFAMGDVISSHASRGFAGTTFGLVASLPLYNGGERHAHVQTGEAEQRKQEQEEERIELQVVQEVNTALLTLRAAERNIQTVRTGQTAAQEGYRVALERYQAGRSLAVEVQDALTARTQAENEVVQALFQYNVARDQLLRATGMLNSPQIK